MDTATHFFSRLKELTGRLVPRYDAFKYLDSVRTVKLGKRSARLPGTPWRGLVPRGKSFRRQLAALLKALD